MIMLKSHVFYSKLPERLAGNFQRSVRQIQDRRRYNRLLELEERILDDIGVTREEVVYGSRLPLARNAAMELRRISQARRRGQ